MIRWVNTHTLYVHTCMYIKYTHIYISYIYIIYTYTHTLYTYISHLEESLAHSATGAFADGITIIKFSIPQREKVASIWKSRPLP